ncbi:TMhelix containing protein [Vibrio phage 1.162.O._10N.261.48.E3]|nr:TMhelix containing protein [Vibrio phage 1.147.O._10N.286.49.E9]AUR91703.1 TMhelix containing protein [Vibrio phage 1.162.O._10N.261.48.E3]
MSRVIIMLIITLITGAGLYYSTGYAIGWLTSQPTYIAPIMRARRARRNKPLAGHVIDL